LTFTVYAQNNKLTVTKTSATELKIETENIDELRDFDWEIATKMFPSNKNNQEITLVFAYVNKTEIDKSKIRVDNFEFKVTGKTSDLDTLTSKLKKIFVKLSELNKKYKN